MSHRFTGVHIAILTATILSATAAQSNPPPIVGGGTVSNLPREIRSLVDLKIDSLTTRTNSQRMAWARPNVINPSKHAVGVDIRVTVDTLDGKPTTTLNQHLSVPANSLAATDFLLPVFACAKITVNIRPSSSNVRDPDATNNEKTALLLCVK
jgi:hypothetical protein